MNVNSIYLLFGLAVSLVLTFFIIKRMGKSGCMTYGYVALLIVSINSMAVGSMFFMYSASHDIYSVITSGENYTSTVISFTSEEHHDSDDGSSYTMYTPTVRFITQNNKVVVRELEFSTSRMNVGNTYKVNYNKETDKVITLGFNLAIKFIGAFIFFFIFSFLFVGVIMYAFNRDMKAYTALVSKIGFYFFIPFLMIGFNLLLIYGIFFGNTVPFWVTLLLIFFVFMLTLATFGYLKMMFLKGEPKLKQVGASKWVGDWKNKKIK